MPCQLASYGSTARLTIGFHMIALNQEVITNRLSVVQVIRPLALKLIFSTLGVVWSEWSSNLLVRDFLYTRLFRIFILKPDGSQRLRSCLHRKHINYVNDIVSYKQPVTISKQLLPARGHNLLDGEDHIFYPTDFRKGRGAS